MAHHGKNTTDRELWEEYNNWNAGGHWYSWDSALGLGLWFISMAIAFAIVMWAIKF